MMNKKVAIVLAFMALFAFPAKAQDFAVRMNSGDSLFLEITDYQNHLVTIVPPNSYGPDYYKGHRKVAGILIIPSDVSFNGQRYTITAIGERAFSGCTGIRMVSFPMTVTTIGASAFYGCVGINDPVIIGENITYVGPSAFYGCSQLPAVAFMARRCDFMGGSLATSAFGNCGRLKKVTIGDGVTRIPDYAFSCNDAINSAVTFPQSLEYIGAYAFSFCSKLPGDIIIPDEVTTIGECAFNQCHSITTLTIGASVDKIGSRAFHKCIGLRSVTLNAKTPPSIEISTFSSVSKSLTYSIPCVSKVLYEKNTTWKKLGPFSLHGGCTLSVEVDAAAPEEAIVLGSGSYRYGDSVTLCVVCAAGYGFVGWTDGNLENPRTIAVTDDIKLSALTHVARKIVTTDTVYSIDTVYSEGYKIIHDTVDVFKVLQPIDGTQTAVSFDAARKRVVWELPKGERMVSLMIFNSKGECIYRTDRSSGKLKMRRFPTGSYFVRLETVRRAQTYHFFMNNE